MARPKTGEALASCLGILLIGCLIQAAGWLRGDRLVFPGTADILRAVIRLLKRGDTYRKVWVTLRHLLKGLALATAVGLPLGLIAGVSDFTRALLRPMMIALRALPMIVMVVIIMVLTRYERVPVIATALFLIPLISEAACEGLRSIEPELIDVYRLNSPFNLRVLLNVHLPLMAGYLKQAYVSAVGMGLKLVVSTEYLVQTKNSLGKAVHSASYFNEYQDIYAYALIMILLVLLVGEVPVIVSRWAGRVKRQQATGNRQQSS